MSLSLVYRWIQCRVDLQGISDDLSSKYVAPHVNLFYCIGGLTLTCFLLQVASGFSLSLLYRPSLSAAFSAVSYITIFSPCGWMLRSLHSWGASAMILGLLLHLTRVYLTGGFKSPREITWLSGVALSSLSVSSSSTGYSLPWDQVGFWACKILTSLPTAIPYLGGAGANILRGAASVGGATLTRFYVAHTFIFPLLSTTILLTHFLLIRKHGISGPV